MYNRLWFWSSFDLFLIKLDQIWSLFWLKDWKRWPCCIKDRKSWLKDQKCHFISKKSIHIEKVNQILSLLLYFWSLLINFKLFNWIWKQYNQFCHDNLDSNAKIRSKKLIKRRFESDFKWILSQSRSNAIVSQPFNEHRTLKLFWKPIKFRSKHLFQHKMLIILTLLWESSRLLRDQYLAP